MKKVFYVQRDDPKHGGTLVEIPEQSLGTTLRQHPTWKVMDVSTDVEIKVKSTEIPQQPEFHCPICGLMSKSEHGLKVHKSRMH